ncbi:protein odr-4 homolog isoform X1 [Polypterus senegalus]|uniref:protein odr-4 homolog isoform X1 n=2 Tax=Polypterus senegalus TaxID=55291 RepID=UPI001963FDE9|nr:protein odr-4 homolog isoform X1 [Polypterus senegalus]XP_039590948.1 protein odr-4 homolog isoform X1 [Polypterus senegalus]
MGRSYFVEESIQNYLLNLSNNFNKKHVTGILIGQTSTARDFIIQAIQTPPKEEPFQNHSKKGFHLDETDEEWITEHARQVSRMMTGGLAILGVFLIVPPALSKEASNMLRRLVFAVDKSVTTGRLWKLSEEEVYDRVTVQMCSETKKVNCRTFDVKDPLSSPKPADWKYQSGVSSTWPLLQCNVEVDLRLPVIASSVEHEFNQNIMNGLKNWALKMEKCYYLINGQVRDPDKEILEVHKKNSRASAHRECFSVQLLVPLMQDDQGDYMAKVQECSKNIILKGVVHCKAYIHSNKPTVADAVRALKRDLLDTISIRYEMLFEDVFSSNEDERAKGQKIDHALPQRVFVQASISEILSCDYIFRDETFIEVKERFKEMFDCEVSEDKVDLLQEIVSVPAVCPDLEICQDHSPMILGKNVEKQKTAGVALAIGVALLALAASFFYFSD